MRDWLFTRERRAIMRAVGQLGVAVVVGQGLMRLAMQAHSCWSEGLSACPFEIGGWWFGPVAAVLDVALGLGLLWLTGRESRAGGAVGLAWVLLLVPLFWLVVASVGGSIADGAFVPVYVISLIVNLWTLVPAAMLIASYRGPSLGLDERSTLGVRSVWLRLIVALPILSWGAFWATEMLGMNGAATAPLLLAAGALYGLGRRVQPLPGAADWLPVTIILLVLALPAYVLALLESASLREQRAAGFSLALGLLIGLSFRYYHRVRNQRAERDALEVAR